jgi:hypothetical protein
MKTRLLLGVLATAVLCAAAQGSVVSNIGYTVEHSFSWGWADNGNYDGTGSINNNIDFFGVKVVSGAALEAPDPVALAGWSSWLNGNGTAAASGTPLAANFNVTITNVGEIQNTTIDVAAFSAGKLVGTIELQSDNPNGTWHYISGWIPSESDFGGVGGASVPEPATILVWSLLGAASWLGMRVWRGGQRIARRSWSPENRQAILEVIGR